MKTAAFAAVFGLGQLASPSVWASERTRELEAKIEFLEQRLKRVEGLLGSPHRKARVHGVALKPEVGSSASGSRTVNPSPSVASMQQVSTPDPGEKPSTTPERNGDDEAAAPQELAVLRQNSVTLKPQRFEVSTEASYLSRRTVLQTDRALLSNTSIRYGIADWLELSATVPLGFSTRTSSLGPGFATTQHVRGFGDLLVQTNARLFEQTRDLPGVVFSVGLLAPTGPSPYNFSRYRLDGAGGAATPNPRNPLADFYSTGAWGARTNLQFYKTVDPLILFFGGGIDYLLPERINGYTVDSGVRFNYNFGFSFAVSEKTTLGFAINGAYAQPLTVNHREVFDSSGEPIIARLTIIQRVLKNLYLEPSIAFGLNQDAPDVALALGLRAQF